MLYTHINPRHIDADKIESSFCYYNNMMYWIICSQHTIHTITLSFYNNNAHWL